MYFVKFLFIVLFYRASFAFVLRRCLQRELRAKTIPPKDERILRLSLRESSRDSG